MGERFSIIYSEEAMAFLKSLPKKASEKIAYNISKSMIFTDSDLFKKLEGTDIWEFRTQYNGVKYRMLAFWDTEEKTLVIATHGFVKKTPKTPVKEILRAETIRKLYFIEKHKE